MEENQVTLLEFWASPYSARVKIALEEKGIEYEAKEENLQNKSDLLLQTNPVYTKIPVLIHNGKPICESLIILEYIDEVWQGRTPLMPVNPHERAKARFWADFIERKILDPATKIWKETGEVKQEAKKELIKLFKLLEEELGEKPYFHGESFGFLDIAFIGFAPTFYIYKREAEFDMEVECPKLNALVKRCMERESVAKSLPDPQKVYELVLEIKERLGIE